MLRDLHVAGVLTRHEWRLQRRDLVSKIILTVMPLILMVFLLPTYQRAVTVSQPWLGPEPVTGAEQAVPGLSVMFAMFLVAHVGMVFFRDHGWNTWERYLSLDVRVLVLVLSKAAVPFALLVTQLSVLLVAGYLMFDLRVRGSVLALALLVLAFALCLVTLGILGFALCRTVVQMTAAANVLTLILAGLGGAIVPRALLPDWAVPLMPLTPSYWAVRGFQRVISGGAGVGDVIGEISALLLFTAGLAFLVTLTLNPNHRKVSWA